MPGDSDDFQPLHAQRGFDRRAIDFGGNQVEIILSLALVIDHQHGQLLAAVPGAQTLEGACQEVAAASYIVGRQGAALSVQHQAQLGWRGNPYFALVLKDDFAVGQIVGSQRQALDSLRLVQPGKINPGNGYAREDLSVVISAIPGPKNQGEEKEQRHAARQHNQNL